MKFKIVTILYVLLALFTTNVFAAEVEIPYEYEKYHMVLSDMTASDDGTIVAVGTNGSIYTCVADRWIEVEFPIFENLIDVEYGNGCFYALSAFNVYSSSDGINWIKVNNIYHKEDGMFFFNGSDFVIELIEKEVNTKGMLFEKNSGIFLTDNFMDFEKAFDSPNDNLFANADIYQNYGFLQKQENYMDVDEALDILFGNEVNDGKGIIRKAKTFCKATGVEFPVNVDDIEYFGKYKDGCEIFYISNYNLIRAVTDDFITWTETNIDLPNKSEHLYFVNVMYNNGYYIQYHTNERYEYSYTTNIAYSDNLNEWNVIANIENGNRSLYILGGNIYLITSTGIDKLGGSGFIPVLQIKSQKTWSTIKYSNGKYVKWEYNDKIHVYLSDDGQNWSLVENPDSSLTYLSNVDGEAFYDVYWDGEYYIIRPTMCDNGYNPTGVGGNLYIYDASLKLVKELEFDNYILDMSFENGKYNFLTNVDGMLHSSTDLVNWETYGTDMTLPLTNNKTSILKQLNKAEKGFSITDFQTSVKIKDVLNDIIFEDYIHGDIIVNDEHYVKINENNVVLSDDGVYWHTIYFPDGVTSPKSVYVSNNTLYVKNDDVEIRYNIADLYNPAHTYVKVDGKILGFDVEPIIESDRTLVPLRFIFETLGADVNWENTTRTAIVQNDEATILFSIDDTNAKVNNMNKEMDVPARLVNDKTMVPLRFLSEELGFKVEWDEQTKTVIINE